MTLQCIVSNLLVMIFARIPLIHKNKFVNDNNNNYHGYQIMMKNSNPIGNDFCPDPPDPRGPACQTNLAFGHYAAISITQCQCQRGVKDSVFRKYSNNLLV